MPILVNPAHEALMMIIWGEGLSGHGVDGMAFGAVSPTPVGLKTPISLVLVQQPWMGSRDYLLCNELLQILDLYRTSLLWRLDHH